VTQSDAGTYVCYVNNKFGDVNSSAILSVVQPTTASGLFVMLVFGVYSIYFNENLYSFLFFDDLILNAVKS